MYRMFIFGLAICLMALVVIGCGSDTDSDKLGASLKNATEAATDLAGKATDAVTEKSSEMRAEYVAKIEEKLNDVSSKLTDWQGELNDLPATSKPLAEKSLETLKSAQSKAVTVLSDLKSSEISEWQEKMPTVNDAMKNVGDAYSKVESFF